ncbi:MAG: hypothetical protein ACRQFF_09685 [Sphaerochaeta sp.]
MNSLISINSRRDENFSYSNLKEFNIHFYRNKSVEYSIAIQFMRGLAVRSILKMRTTSLKTKRRGGA